MRVPSLPRALVAASLVLVAAAVAAATPATSHLDALRADLVTRGADLVAAGDVISLAKAKVVKAAIKNIDKDKTKSLYGDLKILRKVAGKFALAFESNDPAILKALTEVVPVVDANVTALEARAAGVFNAEFRAEVTDLAAQARALVEAAKSPPPGADSGEARSTAVRDAQKLVESTDKRIAKKDICKGTGTVSVDVEGDEPFAGPFAAVERTYDGSGALETIRFAGYYYDPKAQDPYHEGTIEIYWPGALFHGAGTYSIGGEDDPSLNYTRNGVFYVGISGTIEVTQYDETQKLAQGTFTCTVLDFLGGAATKAMTNGRFRICRFIKPR